MSGSGPVVAVGTVVAGGRTFQTDADGVPIAMPVGRVVSVQQPRHSADGSSRHVDRSASLRASATLMMTPRGGQSSRVQQPTTARATVRELQVDTHSVATGSLPTTTAIVPLTADQKSTVDILLDAGSEIMPGDIAAMIGVDEAQVALYLQQKSGVVQTQVQVLTPLTAADREMAENCRDFIHSLEEANANFGSKGPAVWAYLQNPQASQHSSSAAAASPANTGPLREESSESDGSVDGESPRAEYVHRDPFPVNTHKKPEFMRIIFSWLQKQIAAGREAQKKWSGLVADTDVAHAALDAQLLRFSGETGVTALGPSAWTSKIGEVQAFKTFPEAGIKAYLNSMRAQGGDISGAVLVGVPGRVSHNIEWREQRVTLRYGEVPAEFVKSQEEREFLAALKRAIAASEAEIAELCKGFRVPSYMEDNHPQAEKLREIYERHLGAFYEKTRQFYPVGLFSWLAGDLAHAKDCCPRPTYGVMVAESLTRSYCGRRQLQRGRASAYSTSDGHRIMDTPLGSKVTDPSWVLILPNMKLETVDTSNRVPLLPAMAAATLAVQNKLVPSHYAPCLETVVGIRREEIPVHLGVYANAGKLVLGTGSDLKSAKRKSKGPVKYMVF